MRQGGFYPSALEKGLRSKSARRLTLAEMYIQGVSTCRIVTIGEKLIGAEITSTLVSQTVAKLDQQLQACRDRHEPEATLTRGLQKYASATIALVGWMEENIPGGLTVFVFRKIRGAICGQLVALSG